MKILAWQGDGFALYLRRLTATELAMVFGGVELGSAKQRSRYERPAVG